MSGHGHVTPNPDGSKARCGGPGICPECSKEAAMASAVKVKVFTRPDCTFRYCPDATRCEKACVHPFAGSDPQPKPARLSQVELTDRYLSDIHEYAGILLSKEQTNPTAALTLGLCRLLERSIRREREEAFDRITALRLFARQVWDEADASEPVSVKLGGWAQDALAADDASVGNFR